VQDARVVRLHVGVRPEDGGHPPVEVDRERNLLARRLAVKVDEDDRRLPARLLDELVNDLERPDRGRHEQVAEQIDHRDPGAVACLGDGPPAPRRCSREVRGPDHAVGAREVGRDLLPPPDVVAERDHVRAGREQLVRELRRDPDTVRDVLPVRDHEVQVELFPQPWQPLLDRPQTGPAVHVRDEEDLQGVTCVAAS